MDKDIYAGVLRMHTGTTGISFEAAAIAAIAAMARCEAFNKGLPGALCPLPMIGDCAGCGLFEAVKLIFGETLFGHFEQVIGAR